MIVPVRVFRWCLFAFLVGIAVSYVWRSDLFDATILILAGGVIVGLGRRVPSVYIAALCLCFFAFGYGRSALSSPPTPAVLPPPPFSFSGSVIAEPLYHRGMQTVTINMEEDQQGGGMIRIRLPAFPVVHMGDSLSGACTRSLSGGYSRLTGKKILPLCTGSDATIIAKQTVSFRSLKEKVRTFFQDTIDRGIPQPASDLLGGLLLGVDSTFSETLKNDFRRAGVSHIVAISGYNISLIMMGLWSILRITPLGRRRSYWFLIIGIIGFVGLTGAAAATIRAAVMGILLLTAQYLGRLAHAGHALLVATALMVAWNPSLLLENVGFQLSVLATAGLIYGVPIISSICRSIPSGYGLKELCIQTIAATIATAPLIGAFFHSFSLVAIPANMFIVPLVPFSMALGFGWSIVALALSLLEFVTTGSLFWVAEILGVSLTLLLNSMIRIASFFSNLPYASVSFDLPSWFSLMSAALLYGGMVAGVIVMRSQLRSGDQDGSMRL